jgi:hypothetical protein
MKKHALAIALLSACPAFAAVSSQPAPGLQPSASALSECLRATEMVNGLIEDIRQSITEKVSDVAHLNSRIVREPPDQFQDILLSGGYINEAISVGSTLLHYREFVDKKCSPASHAAQ